MKLYELKKLVREEIRNAIKENDNPGASKYYFQGVRWQAGDWDMDDAEITADNVQDAWTALYKNRPQRTWNGVMITHINDEPLKEPLYNTSK